MLALDVNILVSAYRDDAPDHAAIAGWLTGAFADGDVIGVSSAVVVGAARVLTHPRIFHPPSPVADTWDRLRRFREHPSVRVLEPGTRHLGIVEELCRRADARGNLVADAAHAAVAIEHDAVLISKDRDFARFPGLRWRHPLDPASG